jgi:molybdopterin-containing oxidoreductase family iron-sulfur binding subunit
VSDSDTKHYWRSLGELEGSAEFQDWLEREFPEGAADAPDGITRRTMLQLVGASLSLAGLAACRRPVDNIVPYVNAPEEIVPGVPLRYATTMPFGVNGLGLVVESHEGRPTKIEGNELHPATLGAASAWVQAATYQLYDPDRAREVLYQNNTTTWAKFLDWWKELHAGLATDQGESLAVVLEPFSSPTQARLVEELKRTFPRARVVAYAPLGDENVYAGIAAASGAVYEPVYHFDLARVIVSLDADFLLEDRDSVRHARGFASGRRSGDSMNRLYVVESALTITGIAADHRLRLQSRKVAAFAAALGAELGIGTAAGSAGEIDAKWLQAVARDLKANAGKSLIVAGAHQPAAVHAAVAALNAALGNVGSTVTYVDSKETLRSSTEELKQLVTDMQAGKIKVLVVAGGNPAYDAPADLDFAGALSKVKSRIRLGSHVDETSAKCDWHLPQAHFLESWGDVRSVAGPLSVIQPLIEPLFGGQSTIELLAILRSPEEKPGHDLVRDTWKKLLPAADFERSWNRVLHDGLLKDSALSPVAARMDPKVMGQLAKASGDAEGLEVVFRASASVYDGRYANNAWLQEAPEPVSKLTWDNAAVLSLDTATKLKLKTGDVARLKLRDRELAVPVLVVPGSADQSITLALGYGRTAAGRVGNGVGVNAFVLRTSVGAGFDVGARLEPTGGTHRLVATHDHWSQEGRVVVQEASLEEYRKNPKVAQEHEAELHPQKSLWEDRKYADGPQWGMSIDLNSCIGCNACVLACQSENNIPSVGKDQVSRGREMHWIRVDRYFTGGPEEPESIVFQPVPCQQCENAPCEQVCPVAATVHDAQGLNVMVYNRCIGTRYCSNNCPYKVRRFNFYNFTKDTPETLKMVQNPDVTVRARGVMEKCSYCVQRLNRARIDAKLAGKALEDGDVQTACQQTCPTGAIVFGDIRDPKSKVSETKASDRNYNLLPELNTRPRTTYLMRLRNPNPELEKA